MKNKKVFIALNHFNTPNLVADYGLQLAKQLDRVAYYYGLVKVPVDTPPMSIVGRGVSQQVATQMERVKQAAEQKLINVYLEARKEYPKVDYGIDVGFPEPSILEKTEDDLPYLAVLEGSKDYTTLHEWLGNYETRLAEEIESPVLVVPEEYPWKSVNQIVYLMDLEDHKVDNMRVLSAIAQDLKAKLNVMVISNERDEELERKYLQMTDVMKNLLGYEEVSFQRVFMQESADSVTKLLKVTNADWLAFEHKSQTFLERIFDDYHTKSLILQSEIPVLVF